MKLLVRLEAAHIDARGLITFTLMYQHQHHIIVHFSLTFPPSLTCHRLLSSSAPLPAGVRRASTQPDGTDGEDPGEEQEETPQGERQHEEEAVRAGFQHLQRFVQRV